MSDGKIARPKQGQAIFFASFIRHRVIPITKGTRKSLVMWFGGGLHLNEPRIIFRNTNLC
jgi:predicted 2-oxoglutarate/Fe(II)-dependent dioxygenase YbiX